MQTTYRRVLLVLAAFGVMLASACSSLNGLAGGDAAPSASPRWAVVDAVRHIEPVLDELPLYISGGVLSNNIADDIAQYGPEVQAILAAYFDGAEACVAVGGQLVTETAVGRICSGNTLLTIYDALDAKVRDWAIKAGLDTKEGQTIVAARLVLSAVARPSPGGPFPGYRDEPDVPLADFQALRARLKVKFEALIAAAAAHAAK